MNKFLVALPLSALVLSACQQQQAPVDPAVNDGCLHYSPAQTVLVGKTYTKEVTAPGKMTRKALMMKLDAPTCVSPLASSHADFKRIDNIQDIELVAQSDIVDVFKLEGYRVRAKGALATEQGDGAAAPVGMTLLTIGPADPNQ
ncbi:MAG: hypothetical protein JSR50_09275 [Proteobacteria bacterium]|nr:hypothetical protein [Pseudomonadota bacterium]